MINVGDTIKVIGKTIDGRGKEKEYIPIGTICDVINIDNDKNRGLIVEIIPKNYFIYKVGYWYPVSNVEKGHMEWIKDED